MSGTPPPNYNPNDSLLTGGDTAKIIPVQGGGSMPGGNYNADVSLLSGGETAKIIPVQGGGKPTAPAKGLPSLNDMEDLDVYVLSEGEEIPSAEELSTIAEEESKEGKAKPLEVPCPALEEDEIEETEEKFEASDDASDSKAKEIIRLASREFYIRIPKQKSAGEKGDEDPIFSDWKQGKFTEEEAEFLNTLGLSPKLMYASFYCHDKDWKEELADFLYYLSVFSCYPASSLVMKGECQQVREFLMIVESNLKADQLRKLAEKPIPVAGPITLPELQEAEEEGEEAEEIATSALKKEGSIFDKLKVGIQTLNVDTSKQKEIKTLAQKITGFFKKFKLPSVFGKKSTGDELLDILLDIDAANEKGQIKLGKPEENEPNEEDEQENTEEEEEEEEESDESANTNDPITRHRKQVLRQKLIDYLGPQYEDPKFKAYLDKLIAQRLQKK